MLRLEQLAARQHLVFTIEQAHACDVAPGQVATRVRRRQWQRVYPRVYAATAGPLLIPARLTAALFYAGADALVGHATAAALWGLPVPTSETVHLVIPHGRQVARQPGLEIHRAVDLPAEHRRRLQGLPVTSIDRTVADCLLSVRDRVAARALLAAAVQAGRTSPERLAAATSISGAIRRAWVRQLLDNVAGGSQSELELRFLELCRRFGLPTPDRQVRVGRYRVDAAIGDLLIELDSRSFHLDPASWERDLDRQNALIRRGRVVLRFTWRMITEHPERVAAQIRAALPEAACG